MVTLLIIAFIVGYVAITFEHTIRLNKAATALLLGGACWTIYVLGSQDTHEVVHNLELHLGEISGILFFLIGAMAIVELIDAHDGFEVITSRIKTRKATKLLVIFGVLTFFLSAILDNLTTTIVMVTVLRKLVSDQQLRWRFIGLIVISANAGGAWSPMGDVTTTMLWIGGQVTAGSVIRELIVPSLVCLAIPLAIMYLQFRNQLLLTVEPGPEAKTSESDRNIIFISGIAVLICVPVFKSVTHLPPFVGMLTGLGILWVISEIIHKDKDHADRQQFSVAHALGKIDTPSVLFFLGILLAVGTLQSTGVLVNVAQWLQSSIGNIAIIVLLIGLLSALVDNVPLVAAAMGMYTLDEYPVDSYFWTFLAYCAGTGGSTLIIGSAAGVAAMGMEKIGFFSFLKRTSWLALLGYLGGAACFMLLH